MDLHARNLSSASDHRKEEEMDVRKGPWTVEEDNLLVNYITVHGEGRWNSVAPCAGLKRTGKSCRLRWLNYLRPNVRRGDITLQEQLLILELHSRWGNRWSKIAKCLPGRTDNEIKNYWRTRVQKQAKQLKCEVNSKEFRDAMRYVWMPRLMERIQAASGSSAAQLDVGSNYGPNCVANLQSAASLNPTNPGLENSGASSDYSLDTQFSDMTDCYNPPSNYYGYNGFGSYPENVGLIDPEQEQNEGWLGGGESLESVWNDENILFLRQQLSLS